MKIIAKILIITSLFFTLTVGSVFAQSPSPTPIPPSYELFYPVVAGKTPGEALYKLKIFKEWFASQLIFNRIKRADYRLILSKKRLVEAEALYVKKDYSLAKKSIEKSIKELEKAIAESKLAETGGMKVTDIVNTIKIVGNTEADFILKSLVESVPSEEKEFLQKSSESIRSLVEKL